MMRSLQAPHRVLCTGFSNGGAYAQLCGIWAAVQWPAAAVRVITWGAPAVGLLAHQTAHFSCGTAPGSSLPMT